MKKLLAVCVLALVIAPLRADEASHRAAATTVVELTAGANVLKSTLPSILAPMLERMRQQNVSAELTAEAKAVVSQWFDREIRWEDVKPKIVSIYMKEYTEQELKDLTAFMRSPLGAKFVSRSPTIVQNTAVAMQEYFQTKQPALQMALQPTIEKAKAAAGK